MFVFSRRGVEGLAYNITSHRKKLSIDRIKRLKELAKIFLVEDIPDTYLYGVGVYYGSMLPKMKLFTETAFREQTLDVVVGTDALALGVNLPAETVVFAQLAKYYDGPITPNEFWQMTGRAGRKGYFDTGYVRYMYSDYESYEYDTGELFDYLKKHRLNGCKCIWISLYHLS